ncbi:hypothetical protein A1sIIB60_00190 [Candidatus Planktophila lacus]|uniref:class I SAM-dependent methyltransferase n=1 Tax=Candidatus Planktophila lacus TaxID=1884913 RepID=UPI000BAC7A12|nr:class I SAM-dependent methyltransferase [Candidatus Planktophila lacus]ASY28451.1 hypothetical protein A1sIIB60_00190 [Candidatus Planktophila lacus]
MKFLEKSKTAIRVWKNFGSIEIFMLLLRKYRSRNSGQSLKIQSYNNFLPSVKFSDPNLQFLKECNLDKAGVSDIEMYKEYLLRREMKDELSRTGFFDQIYDLGPGLSLILFHLLLKTCPNKIIETGVAAGASSNIILYCLDINKNGALVSVDITPNVGELIEDNLKRRWELNILPNLSKKKGFINLLQRNSDASIFLHDSDHSIQWQKFEIKAAIESLPRLEYLLVDDVTDQLNDYVINNLPNWKLLVIDEGRKYSGFMVRDLVIRNVE